MEDTVKRALKAKRESKHIEFKSSFDPSSAQDWCELVKDIVAIANSGGGTILFGVDNGGRPCGFDVEPVLIVDSATITDKLARYTSVQISDFEMVEAEKLGHRLAILDISPLDIPVVFTNPGTYAISGGKQQTAFSRGTIYFRHGAKSEPASREDLRAVVEHNIEAVRQAWVKGVRKVVEAPRGYGVHVLPPDGVPSTARHGTPIRLVNDPSAPAYFRLTPDVSHPFRQKDVISEVNKHILADAKINQFDMRAIRALHCIDKNTAYSHHPKFSTPQYSQAFVDWLLEQC